MVDIHAVGAGGGSIASVDAGGVLHVGPESAGSEPGPVCYGRGGTLPTVTDADLVLGRLDAGAFYGGRRALDPDAAVDALERLGKELGTDAEDAAAAVVRDRRRAHDRRGPSRARRWPARILDGSTSSRSAGWARCTRRPRPRRWACAGCWSRSAAPGFSALGLVSADHVVDASRTYLADWRALDLARLNRLADDLER